jgi:hypothetical protein
LREYLSVLGFSVKTKYYVVSQFMKLISSIIILLTVASCSANNNKVNKHLQKESIDTSYHLINANGRVHRDTNSFRQLRCGLYINNTGDIAFQASDNSYKMDTTGNGRPFDVYLTTVWNARPYDTVYESRDDLKNVVDTASLQILSWEHFKDKKHVYHFTPMVDGGSLSIMAGADPKTFRVLESYFYAVDKKYCYYRGERIEGADRTTFKVFDTAFAINYAMDRFHYYDGDLIMTKEEVKESGLGTRKK